MDATKEKKIREILSIMETFDPSSKEKCEKIKGVLDFQKTVSKEDFKNDFLTYYFVKKINSPTKAERIVQKTLPASEREIMERFTKKGEEKKDLL